MYLQHLQKAPGTNPLESALTKKGGEGYPISIYLEVKLQRQLDLSRIKHRARRSVKWVRRPFRIVSRASTAKRRWIGGTEIRRSVDRVEEPDVRCIEQVKRLRDHLKAPLLVEGYSAPNAKVHGAEVIPNKCVARLNPDPVVVAKDVSIGIETRKLGKAHGRLHRGDQAKKKVACKRIPALRSCNRSIHDHPVAHVIRRERALRSKILAVLRNQHEAGVRPIVDGLRPGIADAVRKIVRQPLVYVDQQPVILRIPTRGRFKIDSNRESAHAGIKRARDEAHSAIFILGTCAPSRIVFRYNLCRIRLVHIEEAAQMHAAYVQAANADRRLRQRIEFDCQAGLHAIRILVILVEAYNHGRPKKSAGRDRLAAREWIRKRVRGVIRIRSIVHKSLQR